MTDNRDTLVSLNRDENAAFLTEFAREFHVLTPSRPETQNAHDVAEVLAEFIRNTAGGSVHVVAESGAGAAACWLAVLHAELVTSLILVAPTAFVRPGDNRDLLERLGEIKAQTLILWGTADDVAPPASGEVYKRSIPMSQRVYIYGAAHSISHDACAAFVRLTLEFIKRGEAFIVNAR